MKVYLDYIFFENLLVNYFLLIQVHIFCKIPIKKLRIIISNVILSFYATIIEILETNFLEINFIKILIIFSTIYISFKPKNMILYLKYFVYYLMFYFIYIGINIFIILFFNITIDKFLTKIMVYLLSALILTIVNRLLWKMWKNNIKDIIIYKIKINNLEIDAFVDTGNSVRDNYNNLDVIFISSNFKEKLLNKKKINKTKLNINTAISEDVLTGYIFEDINISNSQIDINLKKGEIVFIDENIFAQKKYNGLISYDTYIEKLKGATL